MSNKNIELNCMRTKVLDLENLMGKHLEIEFSKEFKSELLEALKNLKIEQKTNRGLSFFIYLLEKNEQTFRYQLSFRILQLIIAQLKIYSFNLTSILVKFVDGISFYLIN